MPNLMHRTERRERRSMRTRRRIRNTSTRLRLSVFRSEHHFYTQIIDDTTGQTLCAVNTLQKDVRGQAPKGYTREAAAHVGQKLAEAAKSKGIEKVTLDRGFYRYHGRVKAFADAARKAGLKF